MQWQFLWPEALLVGLIVPACLWFYIRMEASSGRSARRHPNLFVCNTDRPLIPALIRHTPLLLFLTTLALITIALARPTALIEQFSMRDRVVIAVDVSTSMRAKDVAPSRLHEAKKLARHFVANHADKIRIGLVSFAGTAQAEAEIPTGREELFTAIDRLGHRPGTALGNGLLEALNTLFPEMGSQTLRRRLEQASAIDMTEDEAIIDLEPSSGVRLSRTRTSIVLLSDGQSAVGPTPTAAARLVAELGVPVHPIGIGTAQGSVVREGGWSMRVQLDSAPLEQIARATGGIYQSAQHRVDWSKVIAAGPTRVSAEAVRTEITPFVAALAALTAALGALLCLITKQRVL